MTILPMRIARVDELSEVVALWNEASQWLAEQGTDQWQYPVRVEAIAERIGAGRLWLLDGEDGRPTATVTLDETADSAIWKDSDNPDDALYLHRLVVARRAAGVKLGSLILNWADQQVLDRGRRYLRLDAWTTNRQLQQYYVSEGFRLVRLVQDDDVPSGAADEREAQVDR